MIKSNITQLAWIGGFRIFHLSAQTPTKFLTEYLRVYCLQVHQLAAKTFRQVQTDLQSRVYTAQSIPIHRHTQHYSRTNTIHTSWFQLGPSHLYWNVIHEHIYMYIQSLSGLIHAQSMCVCVWMWMYMCMCTCMCTCMCICMCMCMCLCMCMAAGDWAGALALQTGAYRHSTAGRRQDRTS